jgi:hypothetical protein
MNLAMKELAKLRSTPTTGSTTSSTDTQTTTTTTTTTSSSRSTTRRRVSNKDSVSIKLMQKHSVSTEMSFD